MTSTLDTRSKIRLASSLGASLAAAFPDALFVATALDPFTAATARRIAELAEGERTLVVLLLDPSDPLLPAAARAELGASLRTVSAVITGITGDEWRRQIPAERLVDESAGDAARRQALVVHVHERHALASNP